LHCMPFVPVYPIDTIPVYSHRYRMVAYFIHMFTCITSTMFIIYKTGDYCRHDLMITC